MIGVGGLMHLSRLKSRAFGPFVHNVNEPAVSLTDPCFLKLLGFFSLSGDPLAFYPA